MKHHQPLNGSDLSKRLVKAETSDFWRFLRSLADRHGEHGGVVPRSRIQPESLKPWLGSISIIVWDPASRSYRYKLFGSTLTLKTGRDFTGETIAVWGDAAADMIQKFDRVLDESSCVVSHFTERVFANPFQQVPLESRFEKVLVPVSYTDGPADAIFGYSVGIDHADPFPIPPSMPCECSDREPGDCPYMA